ncbi:hypothetical protein F5Y10DRAFT_250574 [Nemania abortiva]|nr:hypothetical protein F5Y10DRAFT_250574 [Nemania abortiva]
MAKFAFALAILSFILPATATIPLPMTREWACYCQHGAEFVSGINQVCRGLSDRWASMFCNVLAHNCDICAYKLRGEEKSQPPSDDKNHLEQWCRSQGIEDAQLKCHFESYLDPYAEW